MIRTLSAMLVPAAFWSSIAVAENKATVWPVAADIPQVRPVDIGLAGASKPNVARYLMVRGAASPQVSPDGRSLAYLSNVSGEPQLWTVPTAGGAPEQRTFGATVRAIEWTPDGQSILYSADTAGDEREGYFLLSADGTRERVLIPKADAFRQFGGFSDDGRRFIYSSTERNGRDFDVYVGDTATGKTRLVYTGSYGVFPAAWQPGGDLVILSEVRGEDGADLSLLDLATGTARPLLKPSKASANESVSWRPDGKGFYLITNQARDFRAVGYYDLAADTLSIVQASDHDLSDATLSGDGRWLAWLESEDGYSAIRVKNLIDGKTNAAPTSLPRGTYGIAFAKDAPILQITLSASDAAGGVALWNPQTASLTLPVATNWAGLNPATMVRPKVVRFKGRDGVALSGLFYAPTRADGAKPPLVLWLHGGPSAQAVPGWNPVIQYLVARGMAVYDFNYRGSTGFGKAFAGLNDRRLRPNELGDLADAVSHLRGKGLVDGKRAAVMGGSYGGYLTNAAIGAFPDLFTAGVSLVGVMNWVTALQGASPSLKASDREEYGDIADPADRAFFASISPINNIGRIRTPLVVIHGANDPRDPVTESDSLVKGVRANGVEVRYLRFPDEGHGISKVANRVHAYTVAADFLERRFGFTQ